MWNEHSGSFFVSKFCHQFQFNLAAGWSYEIVWYSLTWPRLCVRIRVLDATFVAYLQTKCRQKCSTGPLILHKKEVAKICERRQAHIKHIQTNQYYVPIEIFFSNHMFSRVFYTVFRTQPHPNLNERKMKRAKKDTYIESWNLKPRSPESVLRCTQHTRTSTNRCYKPIPIFSSFAGNVPLFSPDILCFEIRIQTNLQIAELTDSLTCRCDSIFWLVSESMLLFLFP